MYYYQEGIGTSMVWELSIAELNSSDWWNFRVDANTGQILDKNNWTNECSIGHDHGSEVLHLNYNFVFLPKHKYSMKILRLKEILKEKGITGKDFAIMVNITEASDLIHQYPLGPLWYLQARLLSQPTSDTIFWLSAGFSLFQLN